MKKLAITVALGAALVVALAACGDDDDEVTDTPTEISATSTTEQTTDSDVCGDNPDPATSNEVRVSEPFTGDRVESPLTVRGQIAAFEATFLVALKDAGGDTIVEVTGMSLEGQTLSAFETVATFDVDETTPACLWVYEASAMDGSPTNVAQVPVTLVPSGG
jgi:Immunoglobulin-like domain of bacterial spore germination